MKKICTFDGAVGDCGTCTGGIINCVEPWRWPQGLTCQDREELYAKIVMSLEESRIKNEKVTAKWNLLGRFLRLLLGNC